MSSVKGHRLNVRVESGDDALFRQVDATAEQSPSSFVIESARDGSERVLADRTRFVLSEEQWDAFCAALNRPAQVIPAARDLFARA